MGIGMEDQTEGERERERGRNNGRFGSRNP